MKGEWKGLASAGNGREEDRHEEIPLTLPVDMAAALRVAAFQRRSLGDESTTLADLVQEAVGEWLEREIDYSSRFSIRV